MHSGKFLIDIDVKLCRFHWASKCVCKAAAARSAKVHAICEQCLSNRISCAEYLQQIKLKFSPSNIWSNSVFDTRTDYVTMFSIGFYYSVHSLLLKIIFPWFCNVKSLLLRIFSRSCNVAGVIFIKCCSSTTMHQRCSTDRQFEANLSHCRARLGRNFNHKPLFFTSHLTSQSVYTASGWPFSVQSRFYRFFNATNLF